MNKLYGLLVFLLGLIVSIILCATHSNDFGLLSIFSILSIVLGIIVAYWNKIWINS